MGAQPELEYLGQDAQATPPTASALLFTGFEPFPNPVCSADPLQWPGYPGELEATRDRTGSPQAVTAGTAFVNGQPCVAIAFRFDFLGGSMGQVEGTLIVQAIEEATRNRWPLVSVARSGGARMQEGTVALFQMAYIARALVRLAAAGAPHIAVVDDPTTGGIWAALTAAADVIIARAGSQVAFAGNRVRPGLVHKQSPSSGEGKHAAGFIDVVAEDAALADTVANYLHLLSPLTRGDTAPPDIPTLTREPTAPPPSGWGSVQAARSPQRTSSERYLSDYFDSTAPLSGDRAGGLDPQLRCGLGRRDGRTIAFICQLGGTAHASGFRTASRVLALADRLCLPVVTFIDTSGADNSPEAELSGVGTAIAELLQRLAACTVPVLSVVVGQGVSGAAIALINPDNLWMAPDSYLAVIAPESAAAILKQEPAAIPQIAGQLTLSPQQLTTLGLAHGTLALAHRDTDPR